MIKHLTILLAVILLTGHLFAGVQDDVDSVLRIKDFVAFKKYADSLSNQEKGIEGGWDCLRDLTSEFKEGVFVFKRFDPPLNSGRYTKTTKIYCTNISSVYSYRITIISSKTQIIYYELSEEKNRKVEDKWEPYYNSIDKFKNDSAWLDLQNSFKSIFHTSINENELFITYFAYGSHCGEAGVDPTGREEINTFVSQKDKPALLQWLQSTNTEKQIYAVDGLYQLKKTGIKFTENELKMINFVNNKTGTIHRCSGCVFFEDEIRKITSKFNF